MLTPIQTENLRADIRAAIRSKYKLDSGEIVFGNSTSYTLSTVRKYKDSGRRWRNLGGDSRFEDLCEKLGFLVRRGRTWRVFAGGKSGWGTPCDVITELAPWEPRKVPTQLRFFTAEEVADLDQGGAGWYYREFYKGKFLSLSGPFESSEAAQKNAIAYRAILDESVPEFTS